MAEKDKFSELDPEKIIQEMREEYWEGISAPEAEVDEDRVQLLLVELAGESFALDATVCKSITKTGRVTRLPKMPSFVLGVINLRGQIVSVVDLADLFGLPKVEAGPKARLVVVESKSIRIAFMVDRVKGIELISASRLRGTQAVSSKLKDEYIKGHVAPEGEEAWTTYLDMEKVIHGPELSFSK